MISDAPKTKRERDWQAESDARTLADAEAIKVDAARLKRAQNAAKKMSDEAQTKAAAMSFVAKNKMNPAARVRSVRG